MGGISVRLRTVSLTLATIYSGMVGFNSVASEFSEKDYFLDLSQVVTATRFSAKKLKRHRYR